ncbi:ly6/PLAUR domain-containing protein 1-like isoform 2-T2 [Synchiropus picturatus]
MVLPMKRELTRLDVSPTRVYWERMRLIVFATLFGVLLDAGDALQIQCYQCEEMKHNDCSTPEYIVNCTVNVQDMCQKEVLVKSDGIHYRKSCASSGACLIASSGYQQFCTGRLNSVCISCCNTPLCNGPKRKRPIPSAAQSHLQKQQLPLLLLSLHLPLLMVLMAS